MSSACGKRPPPAAPLVPGPLVPWSFGPRPFFLWFELWIVWLSGPLVSWSSLPPGLFFFCGPPFIIWLVRVFFSTLSQMPFTFLDLRTSRYLFMCLSQTPWGRQCALRPTSLHLFYSADLHLSIIYLYVTRPCLLFLENPLSAQQKQIDLKKVPKPDRCCCPLICTSQAEVDVSEMLAEVP